jgi:hypothetical protein
MWRSVMSRYDSEQEKFYGRVVDIKLEIIEAKIELV